MWPSFDAGSIGGASALSNYDVRVRRQSRHAGRGCGWTFRSDGVESRTDRDRSAVAIKPAFASRYRNDHGAMQGR